MSFAEVLCPGFRFVTGCNCPKLPGDEVMIGNNLGPVYTVVHVADERAWLRPCASGPDCIVNLDKLRRVAAAES